jgi:type-F conjugative transfer system pilin assembly protein TrbC
MLCVLGLRWAIYVSLAGLLLMVVAVQADSSWVDEQVLQAHQAQQRIQIDRALQQADTLAAGPLEDIIPVMPELPQVDQGTGWSWSQSSGDARELWDRVQQAQSKSSIGHKTESSSIHTPLILISLSMDDQHIRALLAEAQRVQAIVALRGFLNNNLQATVQRLRHVVESSQDDTLDLNGIVIDPTWFRRFNVTGVPTFVLPLEPVLPCSGTDCPVPTHVKATGSATLEYFLDLVARTGNDREQVQAQLVLSRYVVEG